MIFFSRTVSLLLSFLFVLSFSDTHRQDISSSATKTMAFEVYDWRRMNERVRY